MNFNTNFPSSPNSVYIDYVTIEDKPVIEVYPDVPSQSEEVIQTIVSDLFEQAKLETVTFQLGASDSYLTIEGNRIILHYDGSTLAQQWLNPILDKMASSKLVEKPNSNDFKTPGTEKKQVWDFELLESTLLQKDILQLTEVLSYCANVKRLRITSCTITDIALELFFQQLDNSIFKTSLRHLRFEGRVFDRDVARLLIPFLTGNITLESLSIINCGMDEEAAKKLLPQLSNMQSLRSIAFSDNHLENKSAVYIAELLKKNKNITGLGLASNAIDDAGLMALGLVDAPLEVLNLSGLRGITIEGIEFIVKQIPTIRVLRLSECNIVDLKILLICMSHLKNLKELYLDGSKISDVSIQRFTKHIKKIPDHSPLNLLLEETEWLTQGAMASLLNSVKSKNVEVVRLIDEDEEISKPVDAQPILIDEEEGSSKPNAQTTLAKMILELYQKIAEAPEIAEAPTATQDLLDEIKALPYDSKLDPNLVGLSLINALFISLLKKEFTYKEIPGDGQCLFASVVDQLGWDDPTEFRQHIVDEMLKSHNAEKFKHFIPEEEIPGFQKKEEAEELKREVSEEVLDERYEQYCKRMRQKTTWGGELEIRAMIEYLKVIKMPRSIYVFDLSSPPQIIGGRFVPPPGNMYGEGTDPIYLYRKTKCHYDSLVRIEQSTKSEPESPKQNEEVKVKSIPPEEILRTEQQSLRVSAGTGDGGDPELNEEFLKRSMTSLYMSWEEHEESIAKRSRI